MSEEDIVRFEVVTNETPGEKWIPASHLAPLIHALETRSTALTRRAMAEELRKLQRAATANPPLPLKLRVVREKPIHRALGATSGEHGGLLPARWRY